MSEKAMAPHSSTLAWKIPWTEEPGRLQSMGSWRVGHDWATSLSRTGEGNGNPLQCSLLENPRDGGAWWAAVYGVAQSWTRLKWLSGGSSSLVCQSQSPNSSTPPSLPPHMLFSNTHNVSYGTESRVVKSGDLDLYRHRSKSQQYHLLAS